MLLNLLEIMLFVDCVSVLIKGLKNVSCRMFMLGNCVLVSMVKFVEKLMNDLNVVRYNRLSSYRCRCFSIGNCEVIDVFELLILFILNQVVSVVIVSNGI